MTKLFKNEVHAIAYRYFATTLDGKLKSGVPRGCPGGAHQEQARSSRCGGGGRSGRRGGGGSGGAAPMGGAWGRRGAVTTRAIATSTTVGGAFWWARVGVSSQQRECLHLHRPFYEKPVWGTGMWHEKRRVRSAMPGRFDIGPRCSIEARGAGL